MIFKLEKKEFDADLLNLNNPLHLFLSVGEVEVVDEEAECEQLGQGRQTEHCQELQTPNKVLQFGFPRLEFEGEVLLRLPDVSTEYQHGNILNN